MASAGLERAPLAVRGAAWPLKGICSTCQGLKEPSLDHLLWQGILGDPLSVLSSFSRALAPPPPHLWSFSSPFVRRNVRRTNTDGDKHRGMVRDGGLAGKPARYLLIRAFSEM
ncbi:hypothetical protein NQZ68_002979 [Dissostichus eleginoides]|nr:hypothetical protein NQZ68_002979 [Dissostichus eleginoides]